MYSVLYVNYISEFVLKIAIRQHNICIRIAKVKEKPDNIKCW